MHTGRGKQDFVDRAVIHQQVALPALCMSTATTGLDDNLGPRLQIIAAIGPQIGFLGFTLSDTSTSAGIELRHWGFAGVQTGALTKMPNQTVGQGH